MVINCSKKLQRYRISQLESCLQCLSKHVCYISSIKEYLNFFLTFILKFFLLKNSKISEYLQDIEKLALIVGCLCHDLDHRGTNNMFQAESHSALSQLYGTKATMEKHHFNHCIMILNTPGHNIFAHLKPRTYVTVIKYIKEAILATDLADHFSLVFIFAFKFNLIDNLIFF